MKIKRSVKIFLILLFVLSFILIAVYISLPEIFRSILIAQVSFNKDYKIEVGKISGDFYSYISIDSLLISNKNTDEKVLAFKNLKIEYQLLRLFFREIHVTKVRGDSVFVNLYKVRSNKFNLEEIFSITSSNKNITQSKKLKKGKWKITVRDIQLNNTGFIFNDNRTVLSFSGVNLRGNARNSLSETDIFRININRYKGHLDIKSQDIYFSDILAEDFSGQVVITPESIIWNNAKGTIRTGSFTSSGKVLLKEEKYFVQFDTDKINLEEIDNIFIHDGKKNLSGDVTGGVKIFGGFRDFAMEGYAESRDVFAYDQILKNIQSDISLIDNELVLDVKKAEWNEANVRGSFRFFFDKSSFIIKGYGDNVDPVIAFPEIGLSKGTLLFSTGFILEYQTTKSNQDKFTGSFWDVTGKAFGYPVSKSSFNFIKEGDNLQFNEIKLTDGFYSASGFGTVVLGENPYINFEITSGNLRAERFISAINANLEFSGRVSGPTNNLIGNINLRSPQMSIYDFIISEVNLSSDFSLKEKFPDSLGLNGNVRIQKVKFPFSGVDPLENITASYKMDSGKIVFDRFHGKFSKGDFRISGSIDSLFSSIPSSSLNIVFGQIEFEHALGSDLPVARVKLRGNAIVSGWIDSYNINVNSVVYDINIGKYLFDPLIGNINITPEYIDAGFNNDAGSMKISSKFFINAPDIPFTLTASVSRISTEFLLSLVNNPFLKDLSGNFRADITAGGNLVNPDFNLDFSTNIYNTIKKVELGILKGNLSYQDSTLNLSEIKLEHKLYSILFNGEVPVEISINPGRFNFINNGMITGDTRFKNVSLETINYLVNYLPFLQNKTGSLDFMKKIEGQINGYLKLSGILESPDLTGSLTLSNGRIKSEVLTQQTEQFFAFKYKKETTSLSFDITEIEGSINILPSGPGRNDLSIPSLTGKFLGKYNEGSFKLSGVVNLNNFTVDGYEIRFLQTSGVIPIILPDTDVSVENVDLVLKKLPGASKPSITGFIKIYEAKTSIDVIRIQDIFSIIYSIGTDILDIIIKKEEEEPSYDMLSFDLKNDMDINLKIQVKDNVKFTGTQQNFYINAKELQVKGSLNAFTILGDIDIQGGKMYKWGHVFNLTKGLIKFDLEDKFDPELDMVLQTRIQEYLIEIKITGRKSSPMVVFTSIPDLDQSQIFSLLFIHQMPEFLEDGQKFESEFLRELIMEQFITEGFNYVASRYTPGLNRFFDVKRLKIETGEESEEAKELYRATLGKYITPRMFLSYSSYVNTNPRDPSIALNIHVNSYILFKSEINLNPYPERNTGDSIGIEVQRTVDFNKYLFKIFNLELKSIEE
ncbi:MAG: translocation/assembly module TamB domain-containing protein [bacterium]|nr:translocation/assembly module TamB domain-containing protein [bacterium]